MKKERRRSDEALEARPETGRGFPLVLVRTLDAPAANCGLDLAPGSPGARRVLTGAPFALLHLVTWHTPSVAPLSLAPSPRAPSPSSRCAAGSRSSTAAAVGTASWRVPRSAPAPSPTVPAAPADAPPPLAPADACGPW